MHRIGLEQGDDAAARQLRHERTDREEWGIELRLRGQTLRRQRVGRVVAIVADDLREIAVADARPQRLHVWIAKWLLIADWRSHPESSRHLRKDAELPALLVEQRWIREDVAR